MTQMEKKQQAAFDCLLSSNQKGGIEVANYCCAIRSNYFRVKDEEEFREIMSHVYGSEDEISLFEEVLDNQRFFGFGLYGSIAGLCNENDDEDEKSEDSKDEEVGEDESEEETSEEDSEEDKSEESDDKEKKDKKSKKSAKDKKSTKNEGFRLIRIS